MEKLQPLQINSEELTNIQKSLVLTFDRLRVEAFDITGMIYDIKSEFKNVSDDVISEAIKKGSLGHYGQTYKLNTQVVCIWIHKHLQDIKFNPYG